MNWLRTFYIPMLGVFLGIYLVERGRIFLGIFCIVGILVWLAEKAQRTDMLDREVEWMKEALNDKQYRKTWIEDHKKFYDYMTHLLRQEKIKKGMTVEEMYKIIDADDNAPDDFRNYMYFGNEKKKNDNVILKGYGDSIPTPEVILKIRNGKLAGWKGNIY